jgi:hypothetical protein
VDPVIVYQHSLHFEIGLFTVFLVFKFYERVLQTVTGPLISDNFAREDFPEATEDQLKILIYRRLLAVSPLR